MRSAGSLFAIVSVLAIISALFAQVMARLTGLQVPAAASLSVAAPALAAVANAGRGGANTAHDADHAAADAASNTASGSRSAIDSGTGGASAQTLATAPASAASDRSAPVAAWPAVATTAATRYSEPASNVVYARRSTTADAAAGPASNAPAAKSAVNNATMKDAMIKAPTRVLQPIDARNSTRATASAAHPLEIAMRSAPDAPARTAVAPTPEQLRATQCQTLQGYEAALAAQTTAGAAADTPSLSGLREQLAITRARWLELGC